MALFGSAAASSASGSAGQAGDLSKDVAIQQVPEDSVSDLKFSSQSDHLAVASWDKKVRIYEIGSNGEAQGRAAFEHEGPVMSCAWSKDGRQVIGGGADKAARLFDLQSSQTTQVAAHDAPIRAVEMVDIPSANASMLVTGSWDKTIKYWDLRQQTPVATVQVQDRVYSMSSRDKLLVIGTADRWIQVVNLQSPDKIYKSVQSPLKWQTRVVSCFKDGDGFAVGSVEGRCAIQYVEDKDSSLNFSFKCHRVTPPRSADPIQVYAVNAISFHPEHGTFSTAGSDGSFHFWDKDAKHRLKGYPEVGQTISATAFNRNGNIFAYAASYDWSKGHSQYSPQSINKIMLHPVTGDECKPRPKGAGKR